MTAKEYLNQIRLLDLKIRQKIEERDHLKAMAAGNSSPVLSKDKVQTSGSGDKMSRTVDSYVDLEKEIDDLVDRYVDKRDMIINQIVEESYHGSLPSFIAAFISRKELSQEEADEIRRMIDAYRKEG